MISVQSVIACVLLQVVVVSSCGPKSCQWRTCTATYASSFSPLESTIYDNTCITQRKAVSHHYKTNTKNGGGCPSSQVCGQKDVTRRWCKCVESKVTSGGWSQWKRSTESGKCVQKRHEVSNVERKVNFQATKCVIKDSNWNPKKETRPC